MNKFEKEVYDLFLATYKEIDESIDQEYETRNVLDEEDKEEDKPDDNGGQNYESGLQAIVFRWAGGEVTSIRGPLLAKYKDFLDRVKSRSSVPVEGEMLPKTPDDTLNRFKGWRATNEL